jgi:hypothetical protein
VVVAVAGVLVLAVVVAVALVVVVAELVVLAVVADLTADLVVAELVVLAVPALARGGSGDRRARRPRGDRGGGSCRPRGARRARALDRDVAQELQELELRADRGGDAGGGRLSTTRSERWSRWRELDVAGDLGPSRGLAVERLAESGGRTAAMPARPWSTSSAAIAAAPALASPAQRGAALAVLDRGARTIPVIQDPPKETHYPRLGGEGPREHATCAVVMARSRPSADAPAASGSGRSPRNAVIGRAVRVRRDAPDRRAGARCGRASGSSSPNPGGSASWTRGDSSG